MSPPVTSEVSEQVVVRIRLLLSEVWEGDLRKVKMPSAEWRARGVAVTGSWAIPLPTFWKAARLEQLHRAGPDHQSTCLSCFTTQPRTPWNNCPKYPVGALLALPSYGCNQPTQTKESS